MIDWNKLKIEEIETERTQDLKEAQETFEGSDLQKRFGPSSIGFHELVDRAFMCHQMWDFVARSPATIIDPEIYEAASRINQAMHDFYQLVAIKEWEAEEAKEKNIGNASLNG